MKFVKSEKIKEKHRILREIAKKKTWDTLSARYSPHAFDDELLIMLTKEILAEIDKEILEEMRKRSCKE